MKPPGGRLRGPQLVRERIPRRSDPTPIRVALADLLAEWEMATVGCRALGRYTSAHTLERWAAALGNVLAGDQNSGTGERPLGVPFDP